MACLSAATPAIRGEYEEIHSANRAKHVNYDGRLFSFVRWNDDEHLIIVGNFDGEKTYALDMTLPPGIVSKWHLEPGRYLLEEQLYGDTASHLVVENGTGTFSVKLGPLESVVYRVARKEIDDEQ